MKPSGSAINDSASGLRAPSLQRAMPQLIQFIGAEVAFQAKQEPVIAVARIKDRFMIDQQRVDDSADLQQRIPLAVVSRKTGNLAGCDSSNLAQADSRDHALEPGAVCNAACGSAQVA